MSPHSLDLSQASGFPGGSSPHEVAWVRPNTYLHAPPPMQRSRAVERAERANANVVILLTLACTVLAIFDLFLLAASS
jgi:hypothetical protein